MQTVHSINQPAAHPGLIADSGLVQDVLSALVETDSIPVGVMCVVGTDTGADGDTPQARLPAAATDLAAGVALGVAMYDASKVPGNYEDTDSIPLVRKGRMWVLAENDMAIVPGAQCFVRHVAGMGEQLGAFRADADGMDAAAIPNCVFRSTSMVVTFQADQYRIALVELNLPGDGL